MLSHLTCFLVLGWCESCPSNSSANLNNQTEATRKDRADARASWFVVWKQSGCRMCMMVTLVWIHKKLFYWTCWAWADKEATSIIQKTKQNPGLQMWKGVDELLKSDFKDKIIPKTYLNSINVAFWHVKFSLTMFPSSCDPNVTFTLNKQCCCCITLRFCLLYNSLFIHTSGPEVCM